MTLDPRWTDRFIGIPFVKGGRGFDGCDCAGLLLLVLKEQFGIVARDGANEYEAGDFSGIAGHRLLAENISGAIQEEWLPVSSDQQPGDMVLFAAKNVPCHVGIFVSPGKMLHVEDGISSCRADIDGIHWRNRLRGYYRHVRM